MRLRTAAALLPALALLAACGPPPANLRIIAGEPFNYRPTGKSIVVTAPVDKRPVEEIEGASTQIKFVAFLGLGVMWVTRGSDVTSREDFVPNAWQEVHQSVIDQVHSTKLFSEVKVQGTGDYVLETEVLHLLASKYRMHMGAVFYGAAAVDNKMFLPQATATVRFRLKDARGRLVGEKVVSGTQNGEVSDIMQLAGIRALPRRALEKALHLGRSLIASWIAEDLYAAVPAATHYDDFERAHGQGHTFLVHMVNEDRSATQLAKIECPSGKVVTSSEVTNLPIVGRPGQWLVSPFDENGMRLPSTVYDALTRHLAQHFVIHRMDQIAAYHYFGERAGQAAAPAPVAAAPPPAAEPPPPPPPRRVEPPRRAAPPRPAQAPIQEPAGTADQVPSVGAEQPSTTPPAPPPAEPPPAAQPPAEPPAGVTPAGPGVQLTPPGPRLMRKKRHVAWLVTTIVAGAGTIATGAWGLADGPLATKASKAHDWNKFDALKAQQPILFYACAGLGAVTIVSLILYLATGSDVPVEPTHAGLTPRLTLAPTPGGAWGAATWRF
jgi:hypothetical protein